MIRENLEFFNVAELEEAKPFSGHILARLPAELRNQVSIRASFIGRNSTCAEIRFVSAATHINLYLSAVRNESWPDNPEIKVMCGNFEHSRHPIALGNMIAVHLTPPDFSRINARTLRPRGFAPEVWRIVCSSPSIIFGGIDTFGAAVRPPLPEEKPAFCCLCYGSSITNSNLDGWPMVMGQRLGIDVLNLGMAGACRIEPLLADYISDRQDWDGIILELGINIISTDSADFAGKVDYILNAVTVKHPGKPVILLTIFPSSRRSAFQKEDGDGAADRDFNVILRAAFQKYKNNGANIHLIEGDEILDDSSCLSTDFTHPKNFGHAVMGLNMAEKLRKIFPVEK